MSLNSLNGIMVFRRIVVLVSLLVCVIASGCYGQDVENDYQFVATKQYYEVVLSSVEIVSLEIGLVESETQKEELSNYLTGPLLEQFEGLQLDTVEALGYTFNTTHIEFNGIRVFEYDDESFTAIVCGTHFVDQVDAEDNVIRSLDPRDFRNLYIFFNEDEQWKMALRVLLNTAYDDWQYAADWERELVGNINPYLYSDCFPLPLE